MNVPIPLGEHHQFIGSSVDCHGVIRVFRPIICPDS